MATSRRLNACCEDILLEIVPAEIINGKLPENVIDDRRGQSAILPGREKVPLSPGRRGKGGDESLKRDSMLEPE